MADINEKQDKGAESPTTARPLDFDDDQQETGIVQNNTSIPNQTTPTRRSSRPEGKVRFAEEEDGLAPPSKPPRSLSPNQQAQNTLVEAFPDIDTKVVKAVLAASGGQVEPAFNALLGMSDPDAVQDTPPPPPKPPRPTSQQRQLEQDELFARQLAEQDGSYGGYRGSRGGYGQRSYGDRAPQPYSRSGGQQGTYQDEKERSFFDDDLPEIQRNLKDGFVQTQTKFNKWINDFRKNFNDSDEDEPVAGRGTAGGRQNFGSSQSDQLHGIQKQADINRARRSQDQHRYDPDPQVMSGDFDQLELRDDEDVPPPKPARPQANPNLFKATPQPPQSGPVDEIDALYGQPIPNRQPSPGSGSKSKKWQPLTSVQPDPTADDNDPFALGDSDDEDKKKDIRAEDTERLKRSASNAEDKKSGEESELKLEPSGRG